MNMKKKQNNKTKPLSPITQKPGKQDSSFVEYSDHSNSVSNPITSAPLSNQLESNQQEMKISENPKRSRFKQRQNQQQKLFISEQLFNKDMELISCEYKGALQKTIKRMKQDDYSEQQIKAVTQKAHRIFLKVKARILQNVCFRSYKSSRQSVPIQVSLSQNFYRHTQIIQNLLFKSLQRLQNIKQPMRVLKFNPQNQNPVMIKIDKNKKISEKQFIQNNSISILRQEVSEVLQYERKVIEWQKKYNQLLNVQNQAKQEIKEQLQISLSMKQRKKKVLKSKQQVLT